MASPDVILYMHPSSCAIVPHILLNYTGVHFKLEPVVAKRLTTDFTTINPKKQVPVLAVDGNTITENPAIIHMINQLAPEAKIMGQEPMQFIRVCEWLNYFSGPMHAQAFGPFLRPHRYTNDPSAEEGIKAASADKLRERFALIESKLPDDRWIVGEEFTAADVYLLPFYQWTKARLEIDVETQYPRWAKIVHRLQDMQSVQKSLNEEQKIREEINNAHLP